MRQQWVGAGRPRVLVVDDEPAIVELITTRLELAGYQTAYARDGFQGMERLYEVRPAALILDINMPRMDGFSMLRRMGQADLTVRVATMVLTARNRPEDVQQAIALGARDYLAKPFDDHKLIARVARLFQKARTQPPEEPEAAPVML